MSQHTVPTGELRTVAVADVHVQDGFNPRDRFDRGELDGLTRSIAAHGVLQPVVVAVDGNGYKLLAGERRYRAAKAAGLEELPAFVRDTGEASGLDLAVVENVMRQDLDPLQEARAYQRLRIVPTIFPRPPTPALPGRARAGSAVAELLDLVGVLAKGASFPPAHMRPLYNDHPLIDALPATKNLSTTRALRDSTRSAGAGAFKRRCLVTETRRGSACIVTWSTGLRSRNSSAAGDRRRGGGDDRA